MGNSSLKKACFIEFGYTSLASATLRPQSHRLEKMALPRQDTGLPKAVPNNEVMEMSSPVGSREGDGGNVIDLPNEPDQLDEQHKSTPEDAGNMRRMGRTQELVRHFRAWSMVSFVAIATSAWELSMFGITPGLVDGGRTVLVWAFLWNFFGFIPVYLSMAEMASMAPIAGAQYHWVSEFAPESYQKILSYLTGYVLLFL